MTRRAAAIRLALAAVVVYLAVPVLHNTADTMPQLYTASSWITRGDASLDAFPRGLSNEILINGHWYSAYPVGLAAIAAPVLAPFILGGASIQDPIFFALFGRALGAVAVALSVGFVYLACRRIAGATPALIAAAGFGFGTGAFAVASQTLDQHSPSLLFVALGTYLATNGRPTAARSGLVFGISVLIRPLDIIAVGFGAVTVWRGGGWPALLRFVAWGVPALVFLLTYNSIALGSPAGVLYGETIPWAFPPPGLAGQLISPSRGLFIFSPYLVLALVGMWRAWSRTDPGRSPLIRDACVAGIAAWLAFASVGWWWSGWSYGNRYLLDILPIVSLAVAYAIETGVLATRRRQVVVGVALAWSVLLQFSGALYAYGYWHGYNWNATPSIDDTPARLWEWGDPQWWSVLRELGTEPGLIVIPALLGILGGALILWPLAAHQREQG